MDLIEQKLFNESFEDLVVDRLRVKDSYFDKCSFNGSRFSSVCFGEGLNCSVYKECSFNEVTFSAPAPGVARFENCSFLDVKIDNFFCTTIAFVNCEFSGEIRKGGFSRHEYSQSGIDFKGNNFERLILNDVSFTNIDLTQQVFLEGGDYMPIYKVDEFLYFANKFLSELDIDQEQGQMVLNIIELEEEGTNNQLLINPLDFPVKFQDAAKKILNHWKYNIK